MKTSILFWICITSAGLAYADDGIDKNQLFRQYTDFRWRARGMGGEVSLFSMQAPFGRYLLLRRGDELLGIVITNHPNPRASEFRWHWFKGQQRNQGSGTFDEKGGRLTLTVGSFKLTWSASDWFYFPDDDLRMARSEITEAEEIERRAGDCDWYDRPRLIETEKRDAEKLRKGLGIEMSAEP